MDKMMQFVLLRCLTLYLRSQFFPSTRRVTIMAQTVLPVELRSVAGASIMVLMTAMIGRTSGGKPNTLRMSISPIIPPPGMAPITAPTRKETAMMLAILERLDISLPKRLNKNTIFRTPPNTDPSLWVFAPSGINEEINPQMALRLLFSVRK